MKALTVDFILITQSMRDLARIQNDYYLDKNTGKVISLSRDLIQSLTKDGTLERKDNLPEWDARMIPTARKIVLNGSQDFVRIPQAFGRPEHTWRLIFTETVRSEKLKQKLTLALRGRGSCQRFKEILKTNLEEYNRWTVFYKESWKERICHWLESISILGFEGKPKKVTTAKKG